MKFASGRESAPGRRRSTGETRASGRASRPCNATPGIAPDYVAHNALRNVKLFHCFKELFPDSNKGYYKDWVDPDDWAVNAVELEGTFGSGSAKKKMQQTVDAKKILCFLIPRLQV